MGHNYIDHNYICHNYIDHNYMGLASVSAVAFWRLGMPVKVITRRLGEQEERKKQDAIQDKSPRPPPCKA